MFLGEIVKKYREEHGMSMDEFAKASGLSKGYISMLEANKNPSSKKPLVPSLETVKAVAKATGVPINKIIDVLDEEQQLSTIKWDEIQPIDIPMWKKRVVGKIAAGYGHEPIYEYTGEEVYVPAIPGYNEDDVLILEVYGTSMYPKFLPKDKVVIKYCSSVDSGDIACVMVDGEATLKKVVYHKEGETEQFMELIPINPEYETKYITGPELNECKVIGKVIKLMRDV